MYRIICIFSFLHYLQQQQSTQTPEFSQKATHPHIDATQPETKEAHASCLPASGPHPCPAFVVSGSSVSQPQTVAHVPAHMHFLCDVLPCPMRSSHTSRQQNISKSVDESHTEGKKTQVPRSSTDARTDEPDHGHIPSTPPAACGAIEGGGKASKRDKKESAHTKVSERRTAMSFTKQKKSRSSIETSTQCTKFKSKYLMYIFLTDILWIRSMLICLAIQTRLPHIKEFPKRSCHGQSSRNRGGARRSLVMDVLVVMHRHPLQSTVP